MTEAQHLRAGTVVTCERGHPICELATTLAAGVTGPLPEHFTGWRAPNEAPALHAPVVGCATCGARYVVSFPGAVHTDAGWWPNAPQALA